MEFLVSYAKQTINSPSWCMCSPISKLSTWYQLLVVVMFDLSVSIATILLLQNMEPTLPIDVLHKQHIICATVHSTFEILCNDNNWMSSLEVNSQETLHMVHLDVGSSWDCNLSVLSESLDFDHFGIWFAATNKYNMATLCFTTFCYNITYKSLQIATSSVSHHAITQSDPSPTCKIVATPILRFGWMLRSLRMIPSQQINGVIDEFTKLQIPEILGHVYGSQCFVLWRWRWNNAKPCKQTKKQYIQFPFYHGLCHCSAGKRKIFVAKLICLPQVSAPKVPASC